ncbi:MAG: class I SAM-dependent methyltransferase [Candidatus Bathyarchaeota archaeon]
MSWRRYERSGEWSFSDEDCIRKEWDDAAESWVDFVRRGKDYYREGLNNPAAFELIGDVTGLAVLDLACGEGYNTRILARKNAKVTGVDLSEKMIESAKQEEEKEKLDICYKVMNAADLREFSNNQFDLATCFMSLQDIRDFEKAISEVARVLKYGGRFVFSIPHPCTEMIRLHKPEGEKIRAIERYFRTMQYTIEWNMERLTKPFKTTSFHRTLTAYFEVLHKSKLVVTRLVEPRPTRKALQKYAGLQDVLEIPQSVVIESAKTREKLQF